MSMMMTPYLHFTGGDALFFKQLTPDSSGGMGGASIVLFFLAMLERYVFAKRASLEAHWKQRLNPQPVSCFRFITITNLPIRAESVANERASIKSLDEDQFMKAGNKSTVDTIARKRVIPPFILSQDVPRGVMHALQALFHFGLMLAIMYASFNLPIPFVY